MPAVSAAAAARLQPGASARVTGAGPALDCRAMLRLPSACVIAILFAAGLPAQVELKDLPALARARADRQRPAQEQAMQPYWGDLSIDYRDNAAFLEGQFAKVVELGDTVVPLLLEKLTPADGRQENRRLAANCRRVLERFDPSTFVDALLELLAGSSATGRSEALRLLGKAGSPRTVQALVDFAATAHGDELLLALAALAQQKAAAPAAKLVPMLGSNDRNVREAVLGYLIAARPAGVADTVVQALGKETDLGLLPHYVAYFHAAVRNSAAAAEALLPLLDRERLDSTEMRFLVKALAQVAPKEHEPTLKRLRELVDTPDPGPLALQAGLTLQQLGDKSGIDTLQKNLAEQLRRRRKDAGLLELRGNLNFAIESWKSAVDDFKEALDLQPGALTQRRLLWQLVRCEAHRGRWSQVVGWLRQLSPTPEEVVEAARDDPVLQEALQKDRVRSYLESLREPNGR